MADLLRPAAQVGTIWYCLPGMDNPIWLIRKGLTGMTDPMWLVWSDRSGTGAV